MVVKELKVDFSVCRKTNYIVQGGFTNIYAVDLSQEQINVAVKSCNNLVSITKGMLNLNWLMHSST